jgi:hypothetical protein
MVRRRRRHLVKPAGAAKRAPAPSSFPKYANARRRPKDLDVRVLHRPRHARHVPLVQLLPDQRRAFPVLPVLPRGLRAAGRDRAHGTGLRLRRRRRVPLARSCRCRGWARSTPPWCAACPTSSFSSSSSSSSTRRSNTCAIPSSAPTGPTRSGRARISSSAPRRGRRNRARRNGCMKPTASRSRSSPTPSSSAPSAATSFTARCGPSRARSWKPPRPTA